MSDKTNDEIDFLANYIAEELMDVNIYDFNSIRSKISFSLKMIKEKEENRKIVPKLKKKVEKHIDLNRHKDSELKFWKDIVRRLVDTDTMEKFYNQVDMIREKLDNDGR
jgi:hypothetical protein